MDRNKARTRSINELQKRCWIFCKEQ